LDNHRPGSSERESSQAFYKGAIYKDENGDVYVFFHNDFTYDGWKEEKTKYNFSPNWRNMQ
jgi:hypothetical protein